MPGDPPACICADVRENFALGISRFNPGISIRHALSNRQFWSRKPDTMVFMPNSEIAISKKRVMVISISDHPPSRERRNEQLNKLLRPINHRYLILTDRRACH